MPDFAIYIIIGTLVLLGIWYRLYKLGSPRFWKLASKYPDRAFEWFIEEDCWLVVDPADPPTVRPPRAEYAGPFFLWIPSLGGKRIKIYGKHEQMDASEAEFIQALAQDGLI